VQLRWGQNALPQDVEVICGAECPMIVTGLTKSKKPAAGGDDRWTQLVREGFTVNRTDRPYVLECGYCNPPALILLRTIATKSPSRPIPSTSSRIRAAEAKSMVSEWAPGLRRAANGAIRCGTWPNSQFESRPLTAFMFLRTRSSFSSKIFRLPRG